MRAVAHPVGRAPTETCLAIARALPAYFTPGALQDMRRALAEGAVFTAQEAADGGWTVAAFMIVERKRRAVAEVTWLAVHPARQGQGYGSALLTAAVTTLRAAGVRFLMVKTLAPESPYVPYAATRRFYERAGFVYLETIDPYPGWEPGNPCAIYVKALMEGA